MPSRRRAPLLTAPCAGAGLPGAARAQANGSFDSAGVRIHCVAALETFLAAHPGLAG